MSHAVFVSHSSKDAAYAQKICSYLESKQIGCWIAPRDIRPGTPYAKGIIDGINESQGMVLVFSAHSNISPQVAREVERAVSRGIPILPVRIDDSLPSDEMEYYISSAHWLDASSKQFDQHLWHIVDSVREMLGRGALAPHPTPSRMAPVRVERNEGYGHWTRFGILLAATSLLGCAIAAFAGSTGNTVSYAPMLAGYAGVALLVSGIRHKNTQILLVAIVDLVTTVAVAGQGHEVNEPMPALGLIGLGGLALTAWPAYRLFFDLDRKRKSTTA